MEKVPQKENSRETIALVLIGIGLLWILKQTVGFFDFPFLHLENVWNPIRNLFHGFFHFVFSWPMILIVIGVLLLAGKRSGGLVFLIIGAIFIIPKIVFMSGAVVFLLFPLILIGIGIALVAKLL